MFSFTLNGLNVGMRVSREYAESIKDARHPHVGG